MGAVLSLVQDGKENVVAYWSQQLDKSQRSYSTIKREALAVVAAVKEFFPYLYGFHFRIVRPQSFDKPKGAARCGG